MTLVKNDAQVEPRYNRYVSISAILLLVAILLMLPFFGRTYDVMPGWSDQRAYLDIMSWVEAGNIRKALDKNYMGPGFIAIVQLVKEITGLDSTSSFLLINRLVVIGSIIMVFLTLSDKKKIVDRIFILVICLTWIFGSNYIYMSGIPWSHFLFGFLGAAYILSIAKLTGFKRVLVAGFILGLCGSVRALETYVLIAATVVNLCSQAIILRSFRFDTRAISTIVMFVLAALFGYSTHYLELGHWHLYSQYDGQLTHEQYNGSTINIRDIPVKIVQFFVDPCFYSVCSLVGYEREAVFVFQEDANLSNFRLPFALQIPIFVIGIVVFFLLALLKFKALWKNMLQPASFIAMSSAVVTAIAYTGYLVGGADQLKYGFSRELFFPSLCVLIWLCMIVSDPGVKAKWRMATVVGVFAATVILLQLLLELVPFPRLNDYWIARSEAVERCDNDTCSIELKYFNSNGDELKIPFDRYAMVKFECAGVPKRSEIVLLKSYRFAKESCPAPYKIIAFSTTTGVSRITRARNFGAVIAQP